MLTGTSASDTSDMPEFNYIKEKDVITAQGFAFLNNIIIDQHFITRKRQVRLINVLLDNPGYRGIGIDEEAAIVVKPDNTMEVIGTNRVMVFEPYKPSAKGSGDVSSFKLTILSSGDKYNF